MMNCIHETPTWTFSKENSDAPKPPNKQKMKQQQRRQPKWSNCMVRVYKAINNIKLLPTRQPS